MVKVIKIVPPLRFPEFNKAWKVKPLSYYFKRHSVPVDVQPERVYQELGVRSHAKGIFHKDPVTGESLGDKRVFWVHPKAFVVNIVFGWEQAIAVTSEKETGFIASHRFPMFLPKDDRCDLDFMLLFFKRKRGKYLLGLASPGGAGRNKTLGQNDFLNLDVSIPEIDEQAKIASFLAILHGKSIKLKLYLDLLKKFKHGVSQRIFSDEVKFMQDDGSSFPEWSEKSLGQLGSFIGGGTPSTEIPEFWQGKIPWISSSDLVDGDITEVSISRFISEIAIKHSATKLVPANSILIVSRVGLGKLAITNQAVCTSQDFSNFIPKNCNPLFIAYLLRFNRKKLLSLAQGTSIKGFTNSDLANLKLMVPCLAEQEKIASLLSAYDQKIKAIKQQIKKLEIFKQGLLQQMFV